MKTVGKTLKIYLIEGNEFSGRTIDVGNWSGRAVYSTRIYANEILKRNEFDKPGIYILKGFSENDINEKIYIGEAEVLRIRIKQHLTDSRKDFFTELIVFISKDELLTKSHIKYLESRLIQMAKDAKSAEIENGNYPTMAFLSEADIADMEYFLEQIKLVLPITGFSFLIPSVLKKENNLEISVKELFKKIYKLRNTRLNATMYPNNQGYVIETGSQCSKNTRPSLGKYWLRLKEKLIQQDILKEKNDYFEFMEDTIFTSSSAAASIITGSQSAGPQVWVDNEGKTLKENELQP